MRRWVAPVVALLSLLVVVAGCSRSGGASSGSAAQPAVGTAGNRGGAAVASAAPAATAAVAPPDVVARAVVRTATMSLRATDVDRVADRASAVAVAAGGRVDTDSRTAAAHLVLRVPAAALDSTLTALAGLGSEVSRRVQGDDVTAQQADVAARVVALQTSVTRLEQLIATSGDLDALLQVETQLTARQSDLESLQAQQRALGDQVALATITLDVATPAAIAAGAAPTGFGHAVVAGWHGVLVFLRYLVAGVGYALPALVLAALLAALVGVGVRRRRRSVVPPPDVTAES